MSCRAIDIYVHMSHCYYPDCYNIETYRKLKDDCSEENIFSSFSGPGVVALDKEPGTVACMYIHITELCVLFSIMA